MDMRLWMMAAASVMVMGLGAGMVEADDGAGGAWPAAVPGFVPPKAGEHPRLFFRKSELPALRARAATPEGKALLERTKFLLDGGEKVRAVIPARERKKDGPEQRYTMFDAAAFGFLYQMTGEKKYAELAKQSMDLWWTPETVDKDDRYSLVPPNEPLRVGPSMAAVAIAYDLCYDAWTPEYRQDIAQKMMTWEGNCKKSGGRMSLERLAMNPANPNPISNHFGLQVGGAGLTLLALGGDPELTAEQQEKVRKWQTEGVDKHAQKVMTEDFGETGYFGEHPGPGVIAMSWTFTPWLKAEKVAHGRDWLSSPAHRAAEWMSLRFVMETLPTPKGPMYLCPVHARGGYGGDEMEQAGGHHATYFSQGLGAIQDYRKPAMLWVYNNFVEPLEHTQIGDGGKRYRDQFKNIDDVKEKSYDAFYYPHRTMYSFLNWPWGQAPENPEKTLPKAAGDPHFGQYIFRNRWQDENDILVGIVFGARTGDHDVRRSMVWGLGLQMTFGDVKPVIRGNPKVGRAVVDYFVPAEDGSGVVGAGGNHIGVDYSKASGADAVVVMVGPCASGAGAANDAKVKVQSVQAGGTTYSIMTLAAGGTHPEAKAGGDKVMLGGQTIAFDGKRLSFGKMAGPPKVKP